MFSFIGDLLGGLGSLLLDLVNGLLRGIVVFLPEEWVTVLVTCLLMTIVGVIIKKKVFG